MPVREKGPRQEQRIFGALLLLVAIAYGAHLIEIWLTPVIPVVVVLLVLGVVFRVVFGRRR
jgi:hypothetical protein